MNIKTLYENVQTKRRIQNKLNNLYDQKADLDQRIEPLRERMLKEIKDVERLENGNLSSFFYELMGKMDQKLDDERKEAYEAKMKYDTASYQLNVINDDINRYERQLSSFDNCEQLYQEALNQKLSELKQSNQESVKIEEKIIASQMLQKEIKEAIDAGNKVESIANQARNALDRADGWSTFDLLGGGLIADIAKYGHLDTAESLIHELQAQLGRFQTELADIKIQSDIQVSIDGFLRTADYIFDNIFTDWAVKDRISHALHQISITYDQIIDVVYRLNQLLEEENQKEENLKQELEKWVVESDTPIF